MQDRWIQTPFHGFDALVQRFDCIARFHLDLFSSQDLALVDIEGCEVHGATRDRDARLQGVARGIPPLESREQRRMGVHDHPRKGLVNRGLQNRAETRHGNELDLVSKQRVDDVGCICKTVEPRTKGGPLDQLDRDPVLGSDVYRVTRPVHDNERDG